MSLRGEGGRGKGAGGRREEKKERERRRERERKWREEGRRERDPSLSVIPCYCNIDNQLIDERVTKICKATVLNKS